MTYRCWTEGNRSHWFSSPLFVTMTLVLRQQWPWLWYWGSNDHDSGIETPMTMTLVLRQQWPWLWYWNSNDHDSGIETPMTSNWQRPVTTLSVMQRYVDIHTACNETQVDSVNKVYCVILRLNFFFRMGWKSLMVPLYLCSRKKMCLIIWIWSIVTQRTETGTRLTQPSKPM